MHGFGLARFVKTERNGRAAVADMLAAADDLRPVNMPEGNVVGGGEVLRRKRVQRTDIDLAHRITLTGSDGGEVSGGNDRNGLIAAQGAGFRMLLVIIAGDGLQQMLLFFAAGQTCLALHDIARA